MEALPITRTYDLTHFNKPGSIGIFLKIGDVVKAEVMEVFEYGIVSLRIDSIFNKDNIAHKNIIMAKSYIPMTKGDKIFLEVLSGNKNMNIRLRLIDSSQEDLISLKTLSDRIPQKILTMLSEISVSKLNSTDFKMIREMLNAIPNSVKMYLPEIKMFNSFMPEIEHLNGTILREAVESSGVLFETQLLSSFKQLEQNLLDSQDIDIDDNSAFHDLKSIVSQLINSQSKIDQKGLLLKIIDLLKDKTVLDLFNSSDIKLKDLQETVNRLIENIEYYQLKSYAHDVLYTFLPVSWQDLREGELAIRKNNKKKSYACDIKLDLEPAGKLSISITLFENYFFINLYTEKIETKSLINSEKNLLKKRFTDAGLKLTTICVNQKDEIIFGTFNCGEISIKV
jgi:hypothetical protein